jgi:type I restriction enzyme R subunit
LRKVGNRAAHEASGDHRSALSALKFARQLGIWFHRTYGKQPDFNPGPFLPPAEPVDATAALKAEIADLRQRMAESGEAALRAMREAEEHARARESAEERLRKETDERAIWEELAQQTEAEKALILAGRVPDTVSSMAGVAEASASYAAPFTTIKILRIFRPCSRRRSRRPNQSCSSLFSAVRRPHQDRSGRGRYRALIDQQLRDSGWEADTKAQRYASGTRPAKGRNIAIAEWPTSSGPADYALFVGLTLVGVVEGKRRRKNVSAAIDQAERYSNGIAVSEDFVFAGGPWGDHKVPFVFAANGRSYLKQIETESGIWFRDTHDERPTIGAHSLAGRPPRVCLGCWRSIRRCCCRARRAAV